MNTLHTVLVPIDFPAVLSVPKGSQDVHHVECIDSAVTDHHRTITVGDNAQVEFVCLVTASGALSLQHHVRIGAHAVCTFRIITLGSGQIDHQWRAEMTGEHGVSTLEWSAYATGTQTYRLSAQNVFLAPHGSGEMTMRGIAEGRAHITCRGLIEIGQMGTGTDTYLTQEVLMLDASAKVDAVPQLEIKTNDVKASHSASIARITPEDLFYFGARGIPERDARQMFIRGFLGSLTENIEDPDLRERVLAELERKMTVSGT